MTSKFLALLIVSPFLWALETQAQTSESKLAALEKLPVSERRQRLYESAKSEGEAMVYANMDVSAMKPLTDGFMKRYPGAKAASVHFSGASIITRIETEARGETDLRRDFERAVGRVGSHREENRRSLSLA